jgi:hypothetical protein
MVLGLTVVSNFSDIFDVIYRVFPRMKFLEDDIYSEKTVLILYIFDGA